MIKTKTAPKKARRVARLPSPALRSAARSMRGLMRISKAAASAGVSRQTVEYYILIGLVKPIRKNGGRFFDAKLIRRIRLIRQLNDKEYTLRAIRETYLTKK